MEIISKILSNVSDSRATRLAVAAALIDTALAGMVFLILTGAFPDSSSGVTVPYALTFGILYIVFFFVIWFILYIQVRSENEDGFTTVRKKLVGQWLIEYSTNIKETESPLAVNAMGCSIAINPDNQKLEFKFRIRGNRIYKDDASYVVKMISLRRDHDNEYNLFYYFKGEREIKAEIAKHLLAEDGRSNEKVVVEFFAKLGFEAKLNSGFVTNMSGEWYDLNGNIGRLVGLVGAIDDGKLEGRRKLSDLENASFGAAMGELSFSREIS